MSTVELLALGIHHARTTIRTKGNVAHVWVRSVSWHEGLSLGRDRSENALLLESCTILAFPSWVIFESGAANLGGIH
jgi:hypothetical protein